MRGTAIRRIGAAACASAALSLAVPPPALAVRAVSPAEEQTSAAGVTTAVDVSRAAGMAAEAAEAADERLARRIQAELGERADDVSVVVHDRRTGLIIRHNPGMSTQTASIVKVMILVALIHERREDGRAPTAGDRALARVMITRSDNAAASTLLRRAGGSRALYELAARLDMDHTSASGAWGRTLTTASDQVTLMDAIVSGKGLPNRSDRRYVLGLMSDVVPEQAWGVGTVPAGAHAQVKNGWAPLRPASLRWRVNSIGHVTGPGRDYTMAMLSRRNVSEAQGRKVLNKVAELVYREIAAGSTAKASGAMTTPANLPDAAPAWLDSPGHAFPPHPAW